MRSLLRLNGGVRLKYYCFILPHSFEQCIGVGIIVLKIKNTLIHLTSFFKKPAQKLLYLRVLVGELLHHLVKIEKEGGLYGTYVEVISEVL